MTVQAVGVPVPSVNWPALLLLPAVAAGGVVPQALIVGRLAVTMKRVLELTPLLSTVSADVELKPKTSGNLPFVESHIYQLPSEFDTFCCQTLVAGWFVWTITASDPAFVFVV